MTREIGLALLGLGRAGSFHRDSAAALPGLRLRRVFDPDPERMQAFAAASGARSADSVEQAIGADDVDAVIVASPTRSHFDLVMQTLDAGRPVLCEKPLGVDLAEIDGAFDRAAAAGVPLLVAFQRRFDPGFARVIAQARRGDVGPLQYIRSVSRDHPIPSIDYIRSSCGFFHDCGVHDLDVVCQVAGEVPEEIFAYGSSFVEEIAAVGDLDNAVISLRFPSGLLASIDISRNGPYGYDQRLEVLGRDGMLQLDNRPQTPTLHATAQGFASPPVDHSFPTRYREAYREELACFAACVRGEGPVPVTREQVRLDHRLADAAMQSCREGRPVPIDPLRG